jgi:hypothetical protein
MGRSRQAAPDLVVMAARWADTHGQGGAVLTVPWSATGGVCSSSVLAVGQHRLRARHHGGPRTPGGGGSRADQCGLCGARWDSSVTVITPKACDQTGV